MVGIAGVALAFVLGATVFAVTMAAHGRIDKQAEDATYRAYRILSQAIFVMLVVFFLAGERITRIHCITGFGWRAWLLLYALPSWFTAVRALRPSRRCSSDAAQTPFLLAKRH